MKTFIQLKSIEKKLKNLHKYSKFDLIYNLIEIII